MSFQSSLKPWLGTALLAIYLPVPFYLVWLHGFTRTWRRFGNRSYLIHIPFWLAMVAVVLLLHSAWRAGAWPWPVAMSWLSVVPLLLALVLAILTYATIPSRVLHLEQQMSPDRSRHLVTTGILGHMRHPRYVMFTLLALGNVLLTGYPLVLASAVVCTLTYVLVIRLEERELVAYFGAEYETYRREVPAFVPRRRPVQEPHE